MNKKNILIIVFIVTFFSISSSQDDELMNKAVKEYLRGDYIGAIQDFERVLELRKDEKASKLLYKSIVEEGKRKYSKNELNRAKGYFERAHSINPDDFEITGLLSEINKKLGITQQAKQDSANAVDILKKQVSKNRIEKNTFRSRINKLSSQKEKLNKEVKEYKQKIEDADIKIEELSKTTKKKQTLIIFLLMIGGGIIVIFSVILIITLLKVNAGYNSSQYQLEELEEKFSQRMKETGHNSQELEERVARSINNMIDTQKDLVKQISLSASGKAQADIEEIKDNLSRHFEEQQERLLDLLSQQIKSASSEKTEKVDLGDRVITDVNPHIRARADSVELIPKTISDSNVAEKMLRPYLSDSNNRVRANACVAIYQYNSEIATDTLKKMASSPDKWMRLSTAWAVGMIASPDLVFILRKLLDDIDERVKDRAIKAFENMAEIKEDIAGEIKKMINKNRKKQELD